MAKQEKYYEENKYFILKIKNEMRRLRIHQKDMPEYGISESQTSNVLRGYSQPGEKFLRAMAQALNIPYIEILEWAGMVPMERDDYLADEVLLLERFRGLTPASKHDAHEYLAMLTARDNARKKKKDEQIGRADNLTTVERAAVIETGRSLVLAGRNRQTSQTDTHFQPDTIDNQYPR